MIKFGGGVEVRAAFKATREKTPAWGAWIGHVKDVV